MGRHLTNSEQDNMIDLYLTGTPFSTMERVTGRSAKTIRNVLNRRGIPKRPYPSGANHHLWKGGRHRSSEGYIEVLLPLHHPYRGMAQTSGYIKEHRLVMAESLGRWLETTEHVHHINGDKRDNRLGNLQLVSHHGSGTRLMCHECGSHNVGSTELARKSGQKGK